MAKSRIKDVADFMQTARLRYAQALAADARDRQAAEEDVRFAAGDQWRTAARDQREKWGQPVLTWNRLPTFIAQVCNTGRENKPAIKTTAMEGGAQETAVFFQDRIRHLEYECDADIAYDTARRQQVISGRAAVRVSTEYKPGKLFEQRIIIEPIENQFSVLWDPTARQYDRKDAEFCFVFSWLSKDNYERKHGKNTAAAARNYFQSESNPAPDWINIGPSGDLIQEAEYWVKEHAKRTLCLLPDLSTCWEDELPDELDPDHIVGKAVKDEVTVCQYIIDGVEPLDETEFAVPYIPIVPLWGESQIVDGRRENYSLVRNVKDSQRLVNLYVSNIAGEIARMAKTPYIVAEGQIAGREAEWEEINEVPRAVIQYKAKDLNGNLVGAPHREAVEPPIQALTLGLNQAIDAMKAGMGIFDAALGAQANEVSGTAIERRKQQSSITNYHYGDNEARTRKSIGRILLALIPKLDKGDKSVPTRTEDGKTKLVRVNAPHRTPDGKDVHHELDNGNYDIAVSTGPSYLSQRDEANQTYAQIAAHDKNFMTIAGDLYFRTSDMPGADAIADRYEKMLPPQLQPPDPDGAKKLQQSQQAIQQLQTQHQQLTDHVHALAQALEQKQAEQQAKIHIATMQEETKRMRGEAEDALKLALAEITTKAQDVTRAAADQMARDKMAHEAALASVAHGVTAAKQLDAQQHAHELAQAQRDHQAGLQQSQQDHATEQQASAQDAAAQQQQAAQQAPPAQGNETE